MASVTILTFSTEQGADDAVTVVRELQSQNKIRLQDAALVAWGAGKRSPAIRQRLSIASAAPAGGVFWSVLFGLIFFTPMFGIGVGVAFGNVGGIFADFAIDDAFVHAVRASMTEGTSALFLITNQRIADTIRASCQGMAFDLIATRHPIAEERHLREAFIPH